MNITRKMISAIAFSILLTGCGAPAPTPGAQAAPTSAPAPTAAPAVGQGNQPTSEATGPTGHIVIRNATLTLVVSDTEAQLSTIMRMTDELKGYVASSNTTRVERDVRAQLVLRVPAEQLDEALDRLRKLAVEVREENVSGDDVTAEYVDLTSRVKNLEAAEEQLRGILAKASNTDDVLKVFDQLKNVRGEIEQAKGRMQSLSQSAALATITLTLLPDTPAQPVEAPGWRPEGVAKSALERLIGSLQDLANVVIWAALFILPLLVVTLGPVILVVWLLHLRKRKAPAS
jgi:Fe2+ transport system protein B